MAQGAGRSLRVQVTVAAVKPSDPAGHANDERLIAAQLGRVPMGDWSVAARCTFGRPTVILTHPMLADGSPFPTLYWLTCPWIRSRVDTLESAGEIGEWAARLKADSALSADLLAADAIYRERRAAAAGGCDPMPSKGIAGQRDPLATKCLHAHVANALAGIDDPIGTAVLGALEDATCPNDACAADAEVTP